MSWIVTQSGVEFDLLNPRSEMVFLDDIIHSLPRLARFNGHTNEFYSVGQHILEGANYCDAHHMLEWLLHDAHEAYVGDLSGPLKAHCIDFQRIEKRIDDAIRERFRLPRFLSPTVKQIDRRMLATEKASFMPQCRSEWASLYGIEPYEPLAAKGLAEVESLLRQLFGAWIFGDLAKVVYRPNAEVTQ